MVNPYSTRESDASSVVHPTVALLVVTSDVATPEITGATVSTIGGVDVGVVVGVRDSGVAGTAGVAALPSPGKGIAGVAGLVPEGACVGVVLAVILGVEVAPVG